jgi:uncharacterized protein
MLNWIADFFVYELLKLPQEDRLASTLHFFIYDGLKVLILIFLVVSTIAFIRTFFKEESLRNLMQKSRFGIGNIAAAIFGAVTPFCSCSSIPLFIGFLKARVPLGISFSFLITSPLVNEVAFVIMGGLFGWKLAFLYAFSGIALGVLGGIFLGSLKLENQIILDDEARSRHLGQMPTEFKAKLKFAFSSGRKTIKKLFPYVLGGIGLGAIIHGFVPQEFFMTYISQYSILSVPIATIIGIPIYAGCSTIVPVIFGITANGVPLGTSLAFMMGIAGLSLPEAVILKRVMTTKLLATFFASVGVGIILIGYLFNFVSM